MKPLNYFSNFQRTIETPLSNCEINVFFLTWSEKRIIVTGDYGNNVNNKPKFDITDTKSYVPVVTLSTQDNEKLLQQLKTGFKRTTDWNKYQLEPKIYKQNRYLNQLIDPTFQK